MRTAATVAALALAALAGCQAPDVGGPCTFDLTLPTTVTADYLESGKTECDNLVCIRSPTPPPGSKVKNNPYCSKPCVGDADCSPSDTGLYCRKVVLDDVFLASLPASVKQQYLGDTGSFSQYCASPLPQ
ncbi:MAG TPA: adventurous gliding motility lipoprotein CglC [Anaeromyxobacteraceae bacterium]